MVAFKVFRRFNDPEHHHRVRLRHRIDRRAMRWFDDSRLPDRIVCALAERRAIDVKEVFESFEFFARTRRRLRAPEMADLCCGHGLTGALFAVFEPTVNRVLLLDRQRPASVDAVWSALEAVTPWAVEKLTYVEAPLSKTRQHLSPGASVIAVHACGVRTDRVIDHALAGHCNLAVMPCCYFKTARHSPVALQRALGCELATDIDRTYRLEAAGYDVDWTAIPEAITPKNRILVATRRR